MKEMRINSKTSFPLLLKPITILTVILITATGCSNKPTDSSLDNLPDSLVIKLICTFGETIEFNNYLI